MARTKQKKRQTIRIPQEPEAQETEQPEVSEQPEVEAKIEMPVNLESRVSVELTPDEIARYGLKKYFYTYFDGEGDEKKAVVYAAQVLTSFQVSAEYSATNRLQGGLAGDYAIISNKTELVTVVPKTAFEQGYQRVAEKEPAG